MICRKVTKSRIFTKKRLTSHNRLGIISLALKEQCAAMAQVVEHVLGKDEVTSSNLVSSSMIVPRYGTHTENPCFTRVFRVFRVESEIQYLRQTFALFFDEHGLEPTKMHETLFSGR